MQPLYGIEADSLGVEPCVQSTSGIGLLVHFDQHMVTSAQRIGKLVLPDVIKALLLFRVIGSLQCCQPLQVSIAQYRQRVAK